MTSYDKVNKIETKADGSYMVVAGLDQEIEPSDQSRRNSISSTGSRSFLSVILQYLNIFFYLNDLISKKLCFFESRL